MKSLFLLLTSFLVTSAYATDHIVNTVDEAMLLLNKVPAGDKVLLKDGTYADAVIRFHNPNGTAARPVVFAAEHPGKVFFEGNGTLSFSGQYIIVEGFVWQNGGKDLESKSVIEFKNGKEKAAHSMLRDCVIDSYNNSKLDTDNKWVSLFGQYNRVERCLLYNKRNLGATLTVWLDPGQPAHHVVAWNYFLERQNGPESGNGLESIRVGDSKTSMTEAHCVVAFNRFEACDGEIEIISNKSCHNSYLHNTFYNSGGGLTLRHGNDCLCDGNYFDGNGKKDSYGIRIIGEGHTAINNYFTGLKGAKQMLRAPLTIMNGVPNSPLNGYFQVKKATIAGNIFVNCALPDLRMGAFTRAEATLFPDSVIVINNLFFDDAATSGAVYETVSAATNSKIENNTVAGKSLSLPAEKGFISINNKELQKSATGEIRDAKGNQFPAPVNKNISKAGADEVAADITSEAEKNKYGLLLPAMVGPSWKRQ
ncbi:MAG: polysaccharide lyase 6 family protein [Chitinophagaceae bacterium]